MKPLIVIAALLCSTILSTMLYQNNVASKPDYIDTVNIGLQPIKAFIEKNNSVHVLAYQNHEELIYITRFCLAPSVVEPYNSNTDTLLSIEQTNTPDSTINSILSTRHILHSYSKEGYTYKLTSK
ncbi:MAG: hypothetical protein JST82_14360 [Bacteroidetes bacterium]|nr:hypothetical protein [Bacteroidota bacterium]